MKKVILVLMLLCASVSLIGISTASVYASGGKGGGNSNKIPASQVPSPVKISFHSGFPNATQTEWEVTPPVYYGPTIYTASFKQNGQKWQANYYADGTFISAYPKA